MDNDRSKAQQEVLSWASFILFLALFLLFNTFLSPFGR
jgi:hypothetical protein